MFKFHIRGIGTLEFPLSHNLPTFIKPKSYCWGHFIKRSYTILNVFLQVIVIYKYRNDTSTTDFIFLNELVQSRTAWLLVKYKITYLLYK